MNALPNNLGPQSVGLVTGEPERFLSGAYIAIALDDHEAGARSRDGSGNQFDVLKSYWRDPRELDAEIARERRRVLHERDLALLANYRPENFDEEPGFVQPCRERVAAYEMGVDRG